MAKSKLTQKDTQGQEESLDARDGFGAYLDEMSKMKFVDFRKKSVEAFEEIDTGFDIVQDAIRKNIDWYAKDRDKYLDEIGKKFEFMDEDLKQCMESIAEKISVMQGFLYVLMLKNLEEKKDMATQKEIAELLDIDYYNFVGQWVCGPNV